MKLLQPQQLREQKDLDKTREILRTKELNKAAEKARANLAQAEADFQNRLALYLKTWGEEEQKHFERKEMMKAEIRALEKQKESTVQLADDKLKRAENALYEAEQRLQLAIDKENYNLELSERLQDKLDHVGQREQDVLKIEQRLQIQNQNIQRQQADTLERAKELSHQLKLYLADKEQGEKDIYERKLALMRWDRTLMAKDELLKRNEQGLKEWAIRLADERDTLAREFARLSPLNKDKVKVE